MIGFTESATRRWCEALSVSLQRQHISPGGKPYLVRYFVAGWSPTNRQTGPAVFLHHFLASDSDDAVHSHPWGWSASLILAGGYSEERCTPDGKRVTREYKPGDVNVITADDKHRIDLLRQDCWTLFLAGHFEKAWEFAPRCEET